MAFDGLSARLQEITRKLSGKARISEGDLKEVLREVKLALLEADVNYKIVKEFVKVIEEILIDLFVWFAMLISDIIKSCIISEKRAVIVLISSKKASKEISRA